MWRLFSWEVLFVFFSVYVLSFFIPASEAKGKKENRRPNTFFAKKRAKKCGKTAVFKGENPSEKTPAETRGDPWRPVGARAP